VRIAPLFCSLSVHFLDSSSVDCGAGGAAEAVNVAEQAVEFGRESALAWATAAVFVCEECCAPFTDGRTHFAKEIVRVAYE